MGIACQACGATTGGDARFCPECGEKLERHCVSCGAVLEPEARFCGECGANTNASASSSQLSKPVDGNLLGNSRGNVIIHANREGEALSWDKQFDGEPFLHPFFVEASVLVRESGYASASFIQEQLRIAPERAERYLEYMEQLGMVSPTLPDGTRNVLDNYASDQEIDHANFWDESVTIETDPLYDDAVKVVLKINKASITAVKMQLNIGYNRAARLIESMEREGIVSAMDSAGNRVVLKNSSDSGSAGLGSLLGRWFGK